jgi:hypothetical protein
MKRNVSNVTGVCPVKFANDASGDSVNINEDQVFTAEAMKIEVKLPKLQYLLTLKETASTENLGSIQKKMYLTVLHAVIMIAQRWQRRYIMDLTNLKTVIT